MWTVQAYLKAVLIFAFYVDVQVFDKLRHQIRMEVIVHSASSCLNCQLSRQRHVVYMLSTRCLAMLFTVVRREPLCIFIVRGNLISSNL